MDKERMHWLDVAKCLLIISVIVYHIPVFAEQNGVEGLGWMYKSETIVQGLFYASILCNNRFLQHICRNFILAIFL